MDLGSLATAVQFLLAVVVGLYFWNLLRGQQGARAAVQRESRREMERLERLRRVSLTEPLAEKARPARFEEIVGQEDGLRSLRAALCGPNPQHVIIYGPPGVGKTAAARLVLEEAKKNPLSPFGAEARFVELDATTARFDERGIADPLIGSVHDPIYQGAGPLGMAGIPQPRPGAVTRAHGGILFLDEIGELHPVQMNKLLKVLEDRKVFLESAYYNPDDPNLPQHIRDVFENGLPADFRLVGATTRQPEEIPAAIRSRCVEIFFRALKPREIGAIAAGAARRAGAELADDAVRVVEKYAANGREAVNMVQLAVGLAQAEGRRVVTREDLEWVVESGQYSPRPDRRVPEGPQVGSANGLAVMGANSGFLLEVEVALRPARAGRGELRLTGAVDEEEFRGPHGRLLRRQALARSAAENALTALSALVGEDLRAYDVHVNFPGGIPVDGPSAGLTVAVAAFSALRSVPVDHRVAMTGEVSIRGFIRPVGGVVAKVEAAAAAGAKRVLIPRENWQERLARHTEVEVVPVADLAEAVDRAVLGGLAAAGLGGRSGRNGGCDEVLATANAPARPA
ncbi:MAG: ATP-dependent protease LonB [Clostridia bacterium]|nr:ATP-dependent protease LonB [Clostridia bacterium]